MDLEIPKSNKACYSSIIDMLANNADLNITQSILNDIGLNFMCKTNEYFSQTVFHYGAILSWIYISASLLIKYSSIHINILKIPLKGFFHIL